MKYRFSGIARAGYLFVAFFAAVWLFGQSGTGLPFPLRVPAGFTIETISNQVRGARFITVAPNGDVIVALVSRGTVVAITPGASVNASPRLVASGIDRPNDVAFLGNSLYIAGQAGVTVVDDYPKGIGKTRTLFGDMPRNGGHNNRSMALSADGEVYISSGSDCNICKENDKRLATIMKYLADGTAGKVHASGLRNASGLAIDATGRLWAVVNQRDNLSPDHTDLPPDELDLIQEGGNYGWPTTYPVGKVRLPNPEFPGASTVGILPTDFNFQAHSAPLQASFNKASQFPPRYDAALFVAFHGSWNRNPPTGYKVVAVFFENGKPVGSEDFISGWLGAGNAVLGRPVGVAFAPDGTLYVSDDTGYIFRIRYKG